MALNDILIRASSYLLKWSDLPSCLPEINLKLYVSGVVNSNVVLSIIWPAHRSD